MTETFLGANKIGIVHDKYISLKQGMFGERWTKSEVFTLFHLARIAHYLFPQHVPEVRGIRKYKHERSGQDAYSFFVERIEHDKDHTEISAYRNQMNGDLPGKVYMQDGDEDIVIPPTPAVPASKIQATEFLRDKFREAGLYKGKVALSNGSESTLSEGYEVDTFNVIDHEESGEAIFFDFVPAFRSRLEVDNRYYLRFNPEVLIAYIYKNTKGSIRQLCLEEVNKIYKQLPPAAQVFFKDKFQI